MGKRTSTGSCKNEPAWVFTLRVAGKCQGDSPIVVRAFELLQSDKTRDYLTVEVRQRSQVIFSRGQLWTGSPVRGWRDGIDGREAKAAVVSLVAMAPGDTDAQYYGSPAVMLRTPSYKTAATE